MKELNIVASRINSLVADLLDPNEGVTKDEKDILKELKKYTTSIQAILGEVRHIPSKSFTNEDGTYSATKFFYALKNSDPKIFQRVEDYRPVLSVIRLFASKVSRSHYIPNQIGGGKHYSRAVPSVLSVLKRYNNLPYNNWDKSDPQLKYLVGKDLGEVLEFINTYPDFGSLFTQEEMEIVYVEAKGTPRTPYLPRKANSSLTCAATFNDMPVLLKLMLCQHWIFAPDEVSDYAIVHPLDWDSKSPMFNLVANPIEGSPWD